VSARLSRCPLGKSPEREPKRGEYQPSIDVPGLMHGSGERYGKLSVRCRLSVPAVDESFGVKSDQLNKDAGAEVPR
jgi:hypothetical protein